MKIYDFKKLLGPCKKLTKQILFVVLFQGHVYQCKHFEHIRGSFRWFFAEQLRNWAMLGNVAVPSAPLKLGFFKLRKIIRFFSNNQTASNVCRHPNLRGR